MKPSFKVVFLKKSTCGSPEQCTGPTKTAGCAKNTGRGRYPNRYHVVPRITTNILLKKTKFLSRKLDQIISKVKMYVTTLSKKEKPNVTTIFKI